jgi:hypothetical protein
VPQCELTAASFRASQRGVYPPDQFSQVPKYGLTMLVTNDTGLQEYLGNVTKMIRSKDSNGHTTTMVAFRC